MEKVLTNLMFAIVMIVLLNFTGYCDSASVSETSEEVVVSIFN